MEEKKKPIVALLYDFDKTLCTQDMQNYAFIPSLGMVPGDFWREANDFGRRERMDGVLAYMYTMIRKCAQLGVPLTRESLVHCGRSIEFFPGVLDWFERINRFGGLLGAQVEHYVISSGLREIIEGSAIAGAFKEIFASEFYYDADGYPVWPKLAVNFTAKTQFVYRINKGVLDVADDKTLNDSMPDGAWQECQPCRKCGKAGGQAIAVYQAVNKAGVEQLLRQRRVDYIYPADYREGSALEITVKNIIRKMAVSQQLYEENVRQLEAVRKN